MTLDEFVDALAAEAGAATWYVRTYMSGDVPTDSIRAEMPGDNRCFCPLTFVARQRGGPVFAMADWARAAEYLALDRAGGQAVIAAADYGGTGGALRGRLLAAVGLRSV